MSRRLLLLTSLALALLAAPAAGKARPARVLLDRVPEVAQVDYSGCGAAALAMIMDHWGPRIDYMEIVDVVRSMAQGTSLPDMVRGAHFSAASSAVSEAYPACQPAHGYPARPLGYGAFFHASRTPWLEELKDVVARGFPVAVLTDWKPGESGPHYRVVTGYDDREGVIFLQDPWPYGDSLASYRRPGPGWAWPEADFLAVWSLSTEHWGLPGGYRYGAVVVAPWKVHLVAPTSARRGRAFRVEARAEYPCPAPFGRDPAFPRFPARDVQLELRLSPGLEPVGPPVRAPGGGALRPGDPTAPVVFEVRAREDAPPEGVVTVVARGTVSGAVPSWGTTSWSRPYDYTDQVGGQESQEIPIR